MAEENTFDASDFDRFYSHLKAQGIPVDDLRVMDDLKTLANESMTRGVAAQVITDSWLDLQQRTLEDLYNFISKLTDKVQRLPENDPERPEITKQIGLILEFQKRLCGIRQDMVKAVFFPDLLQNDKAPRAGNSFTPCTQWKLGHRHIAFFMAGAFVRFWINGPRSVGIIRGWLAELEQQSRG